MLNSVGVWMPPCGTPVLNSRLDVWFLYVVEALRPSMQFAMNLMIVPGMLSAAAF